MKNKEPAATDKRHKTMKQYRLQPGTSSRIYYLLTVMDDGTMTLEFHGTDRSLTEEVSVNADGWIVAKGAMYPPLDHPNGRWQLMDDVVVAKEHTGTVPMCESESDNTEGLSPACETPEIVPQEDTTTDSTDDTDSYSEPAESEPAEQNDAPAEDESVESVQSVVEKTSAVSHQPSYIEQDLFAQMQIQIDQLRQENDRLCNMIQRERGHMGDGSCVTSSTSREEPSPAPRRRRAVAVETPAAQAVALEQDGGNSQLMKAIGIAAASIAALVIIYNTGLLIPMGLIGLGASGLLK